ncbi:bacteriophage antitermination protein Q [Erwinia tracheiphila]|uniref:Antitermination protein n=1 Tax=Erwinia tracheiphila TaxID=65700 RepID=A0A345CQ30_9GAMM|nr:bacteriophage antitermination protein Q [Erwinia tracheiphila]AXF75547.1 antitermination protein [Erwinia tracheiphila]UIA81904.1 bacteriophage antitermination protein Q [Erwinia tracheiphila]UIA90500.1 bacteriophage antitermination protein Q [Erwinia tracheiphila]
MTPQLLECARIELTRALMDNSGKTKGQLQAFSEHPPAEKDRCPRKHIHMVEFEDGRRVKARNTSLYVLETRRRRRPLPPINDYEFAAAPWRRAVNMLPEHEQAWLRYCYGFDLTFRYQTLICQSVWTAHQQHFPPGLLKKTQKRLIALVWLAAQDVAASNNNDTYKEYAGAALGRLIGSTQQGWSKTYAPHWALMKTAFREMDLSALSGVLNCRGESHPEEDNCLQKL